MRTWMVWAAALVSAFGLVLALGALDVIGEGARAVLYGVLVVVAGVGTSALSRRRRAARRADASDGVEAQLAMRASAATTPVALVVVVALGAWMAVREEWELAAWSYAAAALVVAAHWVIFAVIRRRAV